MSPMQMNASSKDSFASLVQARGLGGARRYAGLDPAQRQDKSPKAGPNSTSKPTRRVFSPATAASGERGFRRPHVNARDWEQLRRQQLSPDDSLDLHRCTLENSRQRVTGFLAAAASGGHRCVRLIHGKSRQRALDQPTIKQELCRLLPEMPEVLAFCPCLDSDGASGSMLVLLRRTARPA